MRSSRSRDEAAKEEGMKWLMVLREKDQRRQEEPLLVLTHCLAPGVGDRESAVESSNSRSRGEAATVAAHTHREAGD